MPLADTARKEAQIKEINRLSLLVDKLVAFAKGDDTALDDVVSRGIAEPITTTITNVVPIDFTKPVALGQSAPAFVGQTEPCPDCGTTMPGHTRGGVACISPAQATAEQQARATPTAPAAHQWTPGTAFVPTAPPAQFAPSSEDDNE
jgi:hypothetical protein